MAHDIGAWLVGLGLDAYVETFVENQIVSGVSAYETDWPY